MTFFEQPPVSRALNRTMFTAGNDGVCLFFFQKGNDFVRVIAAIGHDVLSFDVKRLQNLVTRDTIVDVARRYFVLEGIAECIHDRVDFGS